MTGQLLHYLSHDAIAGIVAFQVVVVLIVIGNAVVLKRPGRDRVGGSGPSVSLLVPARNEAGNIRPCVRSLLAQSYPGIEVIVLDDRSGDETLEILLQEQARDGRLVVLRGGEPQPGWTGKNWACHQLSLAARGEILLFADADTVFFDPEAVDRIVLALRETRADLLSGLPRQLLGTFGETLLVPLLYWAFLSFTPLAAGLVFRRAPFTRAVGQIMAFRRTAYAAIGGHEAVKGSIVDDIALARRVTRAGLRCRVLDATGIVACRMYRGGAEAYAGFTRNLFGAFGYAIVPYVLAWCWLGFAYLLPIVVLALAAMRGSVPTALPAATIALSLVQWVLIHVRLRLPLWPALAYPLSIIAFLTVALRSFVAGIRHDATWKGRPVVRPPIRWI